MFDLVDKIDSETADKVFLNNNQSYNLNLNNKITYISINNQAYINLFNPIYSFKKVIISDGIPIFNQIVKGFNKALEGEIIKEDNESGGYFRLYSVVIMDLGEWYCLGHRNSYYNCRTTNDFRQSIFKGPNQLYQAYGSGLEYYHNFPSDTILTAENSTINGLNSFFISANSYKMIIDIDLNKWVII